MLTFPSEDDVGLRADGGVGALVTTVAGVWSSFFDLRAACLASDAFLLFSSKLHRILL